MGRCAACDDARVHRGHLNLTACSCKPLPQGRDGVVCDCIVRLLTAVETTTLPDGSSATAVEHLEVCRPGGQGDSNGGQRTVCATLR